MLLERFISAIGEECLLDLALPLVAGISGGPDSLCLLELLCRAGFRPLVAHFDHHLRGESGQDAARVAQMAAQRGLAFELGSRDVAAYARAEKLSIEEAARTARYRFLFDCARRIGAQAVAVGHTANDQVETALMHLLRGSGLAGLKGMSYRSLLEGWDAQIPLVRPLLGVWRDEIDSACEEFGLSPLQDASNQDRSYYRNRLRHELIPYLQGYNPGAKEAVWRMTRVLEGDYEIVEQAVEQAWQACQVEEGSGYLALEREKLLSLLPGLQRGALRRAIAKLRPGLRDIDYALVERALAFARQPSRTRRVSLAQGLVLFLEEGRLLLAEEGARIDDAAWPQLSRGINSPAKLESPGRLELGGGWALEAGLAETKAGEFIPRSAGLWEAWLDAGALELPLEVRGMHPGERFQPLGMDGRSQKLSDFWINAGLPRRARARWPLVCTRGEVAWIPGYRIDQRFRVTSSTEKILHLMLRKA
jgi:tRNA(Ile)-lysidine synthase